ncbi:MAG TPA: M28 family peptidase, partial [Gemmatirosa sp.]
AGIAVSGALLAADSLEGRATGRRGSMVAARYIGAWFAGLGLEAAGDSGYFQRVPMASLDSVARRNGAHTVELLDSFTARDSLPAARRLTGGNVVAILRGGDPALQREAILVDAHYDHLGIGTPVAGDSIYNGADDDASGTATVMLVARALAAGPRPRRSVIFLAATGEEVGLVGTRWYIRHPAWPLARTVGNLEIEMVGRPDPLAGGSGRAWLTGYERSTLGDELRAHGIPLVADPRPSQNFFQRSDNIAYAWLGIPAHTLSSYNLHADYHQPTDEADRIDYEHMAAVVNATVRAVRLMADGPRPAWKPGQQPQAPPGVREKLGVAP